MYFKLSKIINFNLNDLLFLNEKFNLDLDCDYELNYILNLLNDYESLFGNDNYILNLKRKIYYFMNENSLICKLIL